MAKKFTFMKRVLSDPFVIGAGYWLLALAILCWALASRVECQ